MGYRSEVKSVIYADKNKIDSFINDNKEAFDYLKSEFDDALQIVDKEDEKIIFLSGDGWKWYPTFKEIQAWDNFMDLAEEKELSVEFVRVGEEPEDIETDYRGNPENVHYYIYPTSIIDVNF